jgi:ribosomal protein L31
MNTPIKKNSDKKSIHPKFYPYKIYLADGTYFETITTKQSEKSKENSFRLEILQKFHPAWTGDGLGKSFSVKKSARTKNTDLDYNSFF